MLTSQLLFNRAPKILVTAIRQEAKGIQIHMEEVKLPPFADDMIPYIENSKDYQKTIRINKFSKVAGYRMNI